MGERISEVRRGDPITADGQNDLIRQVNSVHRPSDTSEGELHHSEAGISSSQRALPRLRLFQLQTSFQLDPSEYAMKATGRPVSHFDSGYAASTHIRDETIWYPIGYLPDERAPFPDQQCLSGLYQILDWVWCYLNPESGRYEILAGIETIRRFQLQEDLPKFGTAYAKAAPRDCGSSLPDFEVLDWCGQGPGNEGDIGYAKRFTDYEIPRWEILHLCGPPETSSSSGIGSSSSGAGGGGGCSFTYQETRFVPTNASSSSGLGQGCVAVDQREVTITITNGNCSPVYGEWERMACFQQCTPCDDLPPPDSSSSGIGSPSSSSSSGISCEHSTPDSGCPGDNCASWGDLWVRIEHQGACSCGDTGWQVLSHLGMCIYQWTDTLSGCTYLVEVGCAAGTWEYHVEMLYDAAARNCVWEATDTSGPVGERLLPYKSSESTDCTCTDNIKICITDIDPT